MPGWSARSIVPAVILLGLALRLPWRWQIIPVAALATCLFLYLYALPGDQGVRGALNFHLLNSALIAADWLSSPWVHGWLGHADPPLDLSGAGHVGARQLVSLL